jgi:hypothetical protein
MKTKVSASIVIALLISAPVFATNPPACTTQSLQDYMNLESQGGCTIGTVVFENFGYPFNSGDTAPIPASAITVVPSGSTQDPSLEFEANWPTNENFNTSIRFTLQLTGKGTHVAQATLAASGGEFEGGTLSLTDSGCLGSLIGCTQPRPLNSGIPFLMELNLTSSSETFSIPGQTATIDQVDALSIVQDPGPTGITNITNSYVVVQ